MSTDSVPVIPCVASDVVPNNEQKIDSTRKKMGLAGTRSLKRCPCIHQFRANKVRMTSYPSTR